MIINLLNWCWIFLSTYITGWALSHVLGKALKTTFRSLWMRLSMGLVFVNVYAEFFSLFYKVGLAATAVLLVLCLISLIIVRKEIKPSFHQRKKDVQQIRGWKIIAACFIGLFFLLISASKPYLGDTYMYHIQAVKWIEQYGVVKGLGNLHFRFAYNSAFECLAALYSWSSWGVGLSLHAANGFYAALMVSYCVLTFRWRPGTGRKALVSDLLKVSTVIYIFGRLLSYGSADTDPLVMHCITFIFIRWFELLEKEHSIDRRNQIKLQDSENLVQSSNGSAAEARYVHTHDFALLAMLGVYACTVKLSAAPVVILALYPIIRLIREKKGRQILLYVIIGILIALPWLIRNVLISGYLIYPVTSINLFDVDWKMPESVVQVDRDGIVMWGRAIQNQDNPMTMDAAEWLPIWFRSLNVQGQILFIAGVAACVVWLIRFLYRVMTKSENTSADIDFAAFGSIVCFVFWMGSAPLLRYGEMYMWVVIMAVFGTMNEGYGKGTTAFLLAASCLALIAEIPSSITMNLDSAGLVIPADYDETFGMVKHATGLYYDDGTAVIIYTPDDGAGGQSDYWYFPETPEEGQLNKLGFRGDRLEDGFYSTLVHQ